jgi:hypothetical protein
MISSKRAMVVGVLVACGSVLGCSLASPTYITSSQESAIDEEDGGSSSSSPGAASGAASGAAPTTCNATDFAKVDLSKLTACGPGNKGGHCYASGKSPMADQLTACPGSKDVCVPDKIILAQGQKLKTCTSGVGAGGGCIQSGFLPALDTQGKGFLKQDVCDAGEICAPCVDPIHGNVPTPFCQPIGVHDADCSASGGAAGTPAPAPAPAPLVGCCTTGGVSNGVCLAESAIPEANRDSTKADTCTSGNKCVPKAMVEGKPVTCSSLLGAGVCMDKCFDEMMSLAGGIGILSKANCGATELCIPCSLASSGGTKVPGCS